MTTYKQQQTTPTKQQQQQQQLTVNHQSCDQLALLEVLLREGRREIRTLRQPIIKMTALAIAPPQLKHTKTPSYNFQTSELASVMNAINIYTCFDVYGIFKRSVGSGLLWVELYIAPLPNHSQLLQEGSNSDTTHIA